GGNAARAAAGPRAGGRPHGAEPPARPRDALRAGARGPRERPRAGAPADLHEPLAAAREPAALPDGTAARPGDARRPSRAGGGSARDALRRESHAPDAAPDARLLGDRAARPRAARRTGAARLRGGVAPGRAG